ncbi:hypothetical protein AGABI1DRAFT_112563 [Agaricus bisporus var. burnettii JB137-S8]|uniref:HMG box domain-containing protein n=1 Tax=Agaricus bisporus var. burnettii (strain JB137-S8 / ATCC MYA-4627 / FGSC 10392) TaxID=597362 RepID=K5W208_AGABU|nr:uncharacterized protein AGABI1DRAFT_112563 [Agaricus bisporus var. burnettii JB137-S8]EKM80834.1 hypothetical protein AGABI1DRAFT_112563 [Agaricus bisporus var. burnettii JB137-S8]
MAGVVRTMPSHTSRITSRVVKAPRPPNAWIIYRSDKVHQLPPLEPGQPRRAQAEVSKMISNMWANESEETRQEYERRAEEAKAAHALKYPGYRFKPMKKEEKKAQREQEQNVRVAKRRDQRKSGSTFERGSATPSVQRTSPLPQYHASINMPINLPSPNQTFVNPLIYPGMPIYTPQARFGPSGPTPPLSAAASPVDSSPSPEAFDVIPNNLSDTIDVNYSENNQNSSCHQALENSTATALFPPFNMADFANEWPLTTAIYNGRLTPELTPPPSWQFGSNQKEEGEAARTAPMETLSFNLDSFDLPDLEANDYPLSAFMNATADPGIFQLVDINPNELMAHPTGEIEVSLGDSLDLSLFPPGLFHGDPSSMPLLTSGDGLLGNFGGASDGVPQYNLNDYVDFKRFGDGGENSTDERYAPPAGTFDGR